MTLEGGLAVLFAVGGQGVQHVIRRGLLALVFLALTEILFPSFFQRRKIQPSIPEFQVIKHEIVHSALTLMGGAIIAMTFKNAVIHGYVVFVDEIDEQSFTPIRLFLEVLVYFLVFDVYFYFGHRLFHTKYLYSIHKSHHFSTSPNALAGFSFNPLEGNVFGLFLPIYCCMATFLVGGVLKQSVIMCGFLQVIQSLLIHSGYELAPAYFFENPVLALFLTPTFHDRHHEHPNCNFSGFFTWLDVLFGTADKDWRTKYARWRRDGRKIEKKCV